MITLIKINTKTKHTLLIILGIIVASVSYAQEPVDSKAEMKKLSFLVGEWEGTGWSRRGPSEPESFIVHEKAEWKLNGSALFVEGIGYTLNKETNEKQFGHNAIAIITNHPNENEFDFNPYSERGGNTETYSKLVGENKLIWGFNTPQGGKIRFTLLLNEHGQWYEYGEFSMDGPSWNKFMEMTLDKVAEL